MKEMWKKYSIWDKIGIYILGAMLVVMILGLILIGTVSITPPKNDLDNNTHNGFLILNNVQKGGNVYLTIGDFIKGSVTTNTGETIKLSAFFDVYKAAVGTMIDSAAQLQTGLIFAVIFTPILLIASLGSFGYSFYIKKR